MKETINTVWEYADFIAGLYVVKTAEKTIEDAGFLSSVLYKIGWNLDSKTPKEDRHDLCMIALSDGMVMRLKTKADVIRHLNDAEDNYRLATLEEVQRAIEYQFQIKSE